MQRCNCKQTFDIRCRCLPTDADGNRNKYFVCCPVGLDTLEWIASNDEVDIEILKEEYW